MQIWKQLHGSIRAQNAGKIKAKANSGSIKISSVSEWLELETTSGSIKIVECNLKENSSIRASSGSVSIDKINDVYMSAETTSGSRKVENTDRKADVELKINTTSGSIRVNK